MGAEKPRSVKTERNEIGLRRKFGKHLGRRQLRLRQRERLIRIRGRLEDLDVGNEGDDRCGGSTAVITQWSCAGGQRGRGKLFLVNETESRDKASLGKMKQLANRGIWIRMKQKESSSVALSLLKQSTTASRTTLCGRTSIRVD